MKKKQTAPQNDVFTRLCQAELHTECLKEYRFYQPRMWRFDYALPAHKIAIEVEGGVWTRGRHVRPQGFLGDMSKYNTAALCGWRLFRTTPDKLMSAAFLNLLKAATGG